MRRPNERKAYVHHQSPSMYLTEADCIRWTAVVQGAVLYGIEKANYKDVVTMETCTRTYGIKMNQTMRIYKYDETDVIRDPVTNAVTAQDQMIWLIRKGDLLLSDSAKETEQRIVYHFTDNSARAFQLPIYEYPNDDDMEPGRFRDAQHGKWSFNISKHFVISDHRLELRIVKVLDVDLSRIPSGNFDQSENPMTGIPYYAAILALKMKLTERRLVVQIIMDEEVICEAEIEDVETDA